VFTSPRMLWLFPSRASGNPMVGVIGNVTERPGLTLLPVMLMRACQRIQPMSPMRANAAVLLDTLMLASSIRRG
jgi:hypothetical protein